MDESQEHFSKLVLDFIRQNVKNLLNQSYESQEAAFNESLKKALKLKIDVLKEKGILVEEQDIPGLYRINGGPEITTNQLCLLLSGVEIKIMSKFQSVSTLPSLDEMKVQFDNYKFEAEFNGFKFDPPPLDGTWIIVWTPKEERTIQFDQSAFGGKGGWFTEKGHAAKGPGKFEPWKLAHMPKL